MQRLKEMLSRWGPACLMMLAIFAFSSRPSTALPNFGWADRLVKKGGHMLGYGLLGLGYWHGFNWQPRRLAQAWGLAILYAASDEFHQSYVPGRHPSAFDVLVFDNAGAALALLMKHFASARRE